MKKTINNFWYRVLISLLLLILLGFIDIKTGYELSFQFFYFIPLAILSIHQRSNQIILFLFSILCALVWGGSDIYAGHVYSSVFIVLWNVSSRLIVFIFFSVFLNTIYKSRIKINDILKELTVRNESLIESINYAKLIQDAIIPDFENYRSMNANAFILNMPKDFLSGDFFWYRKMDETIVFGLIDSTGHGVPGSLLSVAGNTLLNKIVMEHKITCPRTILARLNKELRLLLKSGKIAMNDNMEACIASYNTVTKELNISQTFKGALIIKKNGEVILPDKTGGIIWVERNDDYFVSSTYIVEKGMMLYQFSDGYYDQFGGNSKKEKFYFNRFEELLKKNSSKPVDEQNKVLQTTINNWKGKYPQTDDITVVGTMF